MGGNVGGRESNVQLLTRKEFNNILNHMTKSKRKQSLKIEEKSSTFSQQKQSITPPLLPPQILIELLLLYPRIPAQNPTAQLRPTQPLPQPQNTLP